MSDQRGFSLVEGLLVLIAFTMIGFTGFYVYSSTKSAAKTNDSSNKAVSGNEDKNSDTAKGSERSDTWFLYSPPEKQYSVRLADGWNLVRSEQGTSLYTTINDNLDYTEGTKAEVATPEGGKDAASGFFLNFSTNIDTPSKSEQSVKQTEFKTNLGATVEKYQYTESSPQPVALGQLDQGGVYYNYIIKGGTDKFMAVSYSVQPGETQHFKIIEEVLRTVEFN